jgi:pSer/pThr/pTyr-binding forkhead associated (FHA) protein
MNSRSRAIIVLGMLTMMVAVAAWPASGALQLSVGNPSREHFDTDGAVQLDFGLTDQNGAPVGNLRVDNVEVYENGQRAKILDFRGQGQGRPVDIVFVLDVTESMQPYIDAVKQNVISFAHDLASNNRDYRLGLVTFEDYVVSAAPDCNCAYRKKMTSNVQEFSDWVGSLHAGGGGDIPEDQLDALAYASTFPFRPEAQGIVILVSDAPDHHAGDESAHTQHDQAFWDHHPDKNKDVTDLTADKVAAMFKKNGLTLYAVVPPPFIAPDYALLVSDSHGRSYNIVTEEGRFSELVREIGHSIATQYSLTYRSPDPIDDGTSRKVVLKVNYDGQGAEGDSAYSVPGVGGAAHYSAAGEEGAANESGTGLTQLSFRWWNGAVPLIAILALLALSRAGLGPSADELKAILEGYNQPTIRTPIFRPQPQSAPPRSAAAPPPRPAAPAPAPAAGTGQAKLITVNPVAPLPAEYSVLKDEISLGRGTENDLVVPHASVSRTHARIQRRNGAYQLVDLNSTNGTFLNDQPVHGSVPLSPGSEVRLGEVSFIFRA